MNYNNYGYLQGSTIIRATNTSLGISSPTEEQLLNGGYSKIEQRYETGTTAMEDGVIIEYITAPLPIPASEIRSQRYASDPRISWGGTMITCDMALRIIISLKMRDKLTDASELEKLWLTAFNEIKVENPD